MVLKDMQVSKKHRGNDDNKVKSRANDGGGASRPGNGGGGGGAHYNPAQPRDPQGQWTDGGLMPGQKERLRGMLQEVQKEHTGLAAALKSGTLDNKGLDRLDQINGFVNKNSGLLKQLK